VAVDGDCGADDVGGAFAASPRGANAVGVVDIVPVCAGAFTPSGCDKTADVVGSFGASPRGGAADEMAGAFVVSIRAVDGVGGADVTPMGAGAFALSGCDETADVVVSFVASTRGGGADQVAGAFAVSIRGVDGVGGADVTPVGAGDFTPSSCDETADVVASFVTSARSGADGVAGAGDFTPSDCAAAAGVIECSGCVLSGLSFSWPGAGAALLARFACTGAGVGDVVGALAGSARGAGAFTASAGVTCFS
jgi:hypothetical protein